MEAAAKASDYSVELFAEYEAKNIAFPESEGVKVGTLPQGDIDAWFRALFDSCVTISDDRAERLGIIEENTAVIGAAKESVQG